MCICSKTLPSDSTVLSPQLLCSFPLQPPFQYPGPQGIADISHGSAQAPSLYCVVVWESPLVHVSGAAPGLCTLSGSLPP